MADDWTSSGTTDSKRTATIATHVLVSVAIGFVSVATGILVSYAIEPVSTVGRAVPILVGVIVAVCGGACAALFVPWLVAGGLRSVLQALGNSPAGTPTDRRATQDCPR